MDTISFHHFGYRASTREIGSIEDMSRNKSTYKNEATTRCQPRILLQRTITNTVDVGLHTPMTNKKRVSSKQILPSKKQCGRIVTTHLRHIHFTSFLANLIVGVALHVIHERSDEGRERA